ncbi:kinase A inhibitor [Heyndrickxia sporothermodurans]|nr:kinase A inhibitor [Heyndrickxia sporothermodurans]
MNGYEFSPLGDSGIIIKLGNQIDEQIHQKVINMFDYLRNHPFDGMIEIVSGFTTLTVYYDPIRLFQLGNDYPYEAVQLTLKQILVQLASTASKKKNIIEIPVCYGGEFGPDLEYVAKYNEISINDVIQIHTKSEYLVYMIGFAPGFPYLGGMDERIATPRHCSPRVKIPKGSVGIGGSQTGIYPIESPGGWQLIGKTPIRLFRNEKDHPSLLNAGDFVRFRSITAEEFASWEEG